MGFGIIFIGYFFLLNANINGLDLLPDVLGYIIMLYGFSVASRHSIHFALPGKLCFAGIAIGAVKLVYQILAYMGRDISVGDFGYVLMWVFPMFTVAFNLCLLRAIYVLSAEVGLPGLSVRAVVNMILTTLFLIGATVCETVSGAAALTGNTPGMLITTSMILQIFSAALNLILIFSCYMRICLEGDEDMDEKRSGLKSPLDYYKRDKKK